MKRAISILVGLFVLGSCSRRGVIEDYRYLFGDDFDRTDQALSATSNWNVTIPSQASLLIEGKLLRPLQGNGAAPSAFFTTPAGHTDTMVRVDISVAGGTMLTPNMHILARYDAQSLASATSGYDCGFSGTNYITLIRNGVVVSTGSVSIPFNIGNSYTLVFDQQADSINCFVEGDYYDEARYTDTSHLTGIYNGLAGGVSGYNHGYFDNFEIYGKD